MKRNTKRLILVMSSLAVLVIFLTVNFVNQERKPYIIETVIPEENNSVVNTVIPPTIERVIPNSPSPTFTSTELPIKLKILTEDDKVPECSNYDNPLKIDQFQKFSGSVLIRKNSVWYSLTAGSILTELDEYSNHNNALAVSADEQNLLIYESTPSLIEDNKELSLTLISDGKVFTDKVNVASAFDYARELNIGNQFRYLSIKWLGKNIFRIQYTFTESPQTILFPVFYEYKEFGQDEWLRRNVDSLSRDQWNWLDISPDMSQIIYIDSNNDLVVWNTEKSEKVWSVHYYTFTIPPYVAWSPDNNYFAIWTADNWNRVAIYNRDGSLKQLLQFTDMYFPDVLLAKGEPPFQWSPDSKYISITELKGDTKNHQPWVYVYSLDKENYVYHCPLALNGDKVVYSNVTWAPKGNQLITTYPQTQDFIPLIYDLDDLLVYRVDDEKATVYGWFTKDLGSAFQ